MEVDNLTHESDGFYFSEEVGFVPKTKKQKKDKGDKKDVKEKGNKEKPKN